MIKTYCPKCSKEFILKDETYGTKIICYCAKDFIVKNTVNIWLLIGLMIALYVCLILAQNLPDRYNLIPVAAMVPVGLFVIYYIFKLLFYKNGGKTLYRNLVRAIRFNIGLSLFAIIVLYLAFFAINGGGSETCFGWGCWEVTFIMGSGFVVLPAVLLITIIYFFVIYSRCKNNEKKMFDRNI